VTPTLLILACALTSTSAATSSASASTSTAARGGFRYHPDDPRADHAGTPAEPVPGGAPLGAPGAPRGEDDRRDLPRYDGRPDAEPGAREILVWVPRGLFFPAWLVVEYGLRWPLVSLLTWNETQKITARIGDLLSFRDGRSFIAPTALVDFGLRPSVGFINENAELLRPEHTLILRAGFWGQGWIQGAVESRWQVFARNAEHTFRGYGGTRPDEPFYGVGPGAREVDRSFFRAFRLGGDVRLDASIGGLSRAGVVADVRRVRLEDGQSPRITERFSIAGLSGFDDAYHLVGGDAFLVLDNRDPDRDRTPGTGLRVEGRAGFHADPGPGNVAFFRFTGEASGFWDVTGRNHVLAAQLYGDFVERTTDTPLPIIELPSLGGDEVMRGFLRGRFRGESAVAATVSYRYPIWILLDAELFVAVGNAFDAWLEGFRWDRLALGAGMALRMGLSRDTSVDMLLGFGTNTFGASDFRVESGRFSLGVNHGF
jgi:hypothetical protein